MGKPTGFFFFFLEKTQWNLRHDNRSLKGFFCTWRKRECYRGFIQGIPVLIVKVGKPLSIGENLVKPAAKVMANILFGGKGSDEIKQGTFVQWQTTSMAKNVEAQMVTR